MGMECDVCLIIDVNKQVHIKIYRFFQMALNMTTTMSFLHFCFDFFSDHMVANHQ